MSGNLLAIPLVMAAIAYGHSIDGPFVFDDSNTIVNNPGIRNVWRFLQGEFFAGYIGSSRPVTGLTFALNYACCGLDTRAYHLTNVSLHLAAVILVFLLTKRVLARVKWPRPERLSLAIAGVFALHPVHSQAVSYLSQRSEVLASVGYATTLLLLLEAEDSGVASRRGALAYGAALVVFVLALGAKTIAVTVPLTFVLCSAALPAAGSSPPVAPGLQWRRRLVLAAPFLVLSAVFAALQIVSVSGSRHAGFEIPGLDPWRYLLTQCRVLLTYLRLLAWPSGLNFDHAFAPSSGLLDAGTLVAVLAVGSMIVAALLLLAWSRDQAPGRTHATAARLGAVGVLWFVLILAPTSSVVPLFDVIEEHRLYLASWGILVACGAAAGVVLERVIGGRTARYGPAILTAAVWAMLASALYERNAVYRDELSLWSDAVSKSPDKARPYFSLGYALSARGDHVAALFQYGRALALASDRSVSRRDIARNMSASLFELGRIEEAADLLHRALQAYPGDPELLNNVALTYIRQRNFEKAAQVARQAVTAAPGMALVHITLGQALVGTGDLAGALTQYSVAVGLGRDDLQTTFELAIVQKMVGMRRESCDGFRRVANKATGRLRVDAIEWSLQCNIQ